MENARFLCTNDAKCVRVEQNRQKDTFCFFDRCKKCKKYKVKKSKSQKKLNFICLLSVQTEFLFLNRVTYRY